VSLADRDYFKVHRARPTGFLYLSEPAGGRVTGGRVQAFSRRIDDNRGEFAGVVVGTVDPAYIEKFLGAINLGADGRVYLFRDDGVLLLTHPLTLGDIGHTFSDHPIFKHALAEASSGVRRGAGLLSGETRLTAYQHLKEYPLVVAVSSSEDSILSEWRGDAWRIGGGAAGTALVMVITLFYLLRQMSVGTGLRHDLVQAGERLQGIIHSAMDAIITIDEKQKIVLFNDAAERIFGCPASEAVGASIDRFIPERFRIAHRGHVERFGATRVTTRMMGGRLELFGLRADGGEFPIDASISQVTVDGNKYYTVILRDVTERQAAEVALKRSYEELRELSSAMHEVREAERTRIARELHDELAQWLTAIKMDVSWLSSRLPREQAQLVDKTEKVKALVDTTVNAVRRIASDLRPVMLDDLGLVPAIEGLLHDLSQRTGMVISFDATSGDLDFHEPLATALFRMTQEALTNVARHAGATEVRVTIGLGGGDLVLQVLDNGRGFDAEAASRRKSYGIMGIQERAHTLGGKARITRIDTGGTLVEIVIPVARYRKQGEGA
jgi:two-component system sensor kinase